jgi:hypothetical protein
MSEKTQETEVVKEVGSDTKIEDVCSTVSLEKTSTVTVRLSSTDQSRTPINLDLTLADLGIDPQQTFDQYKRIEFPTDKIKEIANNPDLTTEEKVAQRKQVLAEYQQNQQTLTEIVGAGCVEDLIGVKLVEYLVNNHGYTDKENDKDGKPYLDLNTVQISSIRGVDGSYDIQVNVKAVWGI